MQLIANLRVGFGRQHSHPINNDSFMRTTDRGFFFRRAGTMHISPILLIFAIRYATRVSLTSVPGFFKVSKKLTSIKITHKLTFQKSKIIPSSVLLTPNTIFSQRDKRI